MHRVEILTKKLAKRRIPKRQLYNALDKIGEYFSVEDEMKIEILKSQGLPIFEQNGFFDLLTKYKKIEYETFCIVDIETTGSKPDTSQMIEIAAVKFKNGKIVDKFESFVYTDFIPEHIQRLTNIKIKDVANAPKIKELLEKFKIFLGDTTFIAHSVKFDYNYISATLKKNGYGELLNRKLCTIDLAKRTFKAQKYGLKHLQEHLNLKVKIHHRAYADVLNTVEVFKISLQNLPENIKTTEELIEFSKNGELIE